MIVGKLERAILDLLLLEDKIYKLSIAGKPDQEAKARLKFNKVLDFLRKGPA